MKSTLCIALLAGIAAAGFEKHLIGTSSLWERETCQGVSCAACYGPGNIICQSLGFEDSCFNPSAGEQCCADGSYCVGADNSCCGSIGGGVTVTAVPTSSSPPSNTQSAPLASGSTWDCQPTDSNEQCCQRGGSINFWCSGEDPRQCYRPSLGEECCADGSVCQGSGCCVSDGSSPTTPNAFEATSVPNVAATSSPNLNTGNAFSTPATTRSVSSLSIPGSSSTPTGSSTVVGNEASPRGVFAGALAAVVGVVGLVLM